MDAPRLIDAILRHTTTFVAQLSTAAGLRAPLAHIADQVFLELSKELEAQGVSRKVVASMFGMALRGYQRKVQRLTESVSIKGKTLWEAVVEHLDTHGPTLRYDLNRRFEADGEEHVAAVLHDLTSSGVVYCTGRGDAAVYGLSSAQDRERILMRTRGERLKIAAWYATFRRAGTFGELRSEVQGDPEELKACIGELITEGLVRAEGLPLGDSTRLASERFLVPVGAELGWEVAVFDHFRAVLDAIASKLRLRFEDAEAAKFVGGATLVFDLHKHHPMQDEVLGLLSRVRTDVNEVWSRVSAYNREQPIDADALIPLTFYFGQNVHWPRKDNCHEE
jgi:hypothetical protein